jgi:LPXTG-motif cell wall-anchored protein
VPLPLTNAMAAVNTLLQSAAPLTGGALVRIAAVSAASTFTVPPAAVPRASAPKPVAAPHPAALPHTGGEPGLAVLGVVLAALALGVIRGRRLLAERAHSTTVR